MKNMNEKLLPMEAKGEVQTESVIKSSVEMPYSGIRTFLRRRHTHDLTGVDYAIFGVPFDLATSGRPGARFGPSALREASTHLSCGKVWPWNIAPFKSIEAVDLGDVPFQRGQTNEMMKNTIQFSQSIVDADVSTIMLGGDHCITYNTLKAHASKHGPLALIQFDAHRDILESDYLDHGTFVHHAIKEELIDPEHSIQIGIRTHYEKNDSMQVLYRDWFHENGWQGALSKIKETVGNRKAYLSIDIDSIDPAFAPGTGTPVVDGLHPNDIISILRNSMDLEIVGMDLVEVAPAYDNAEITALLGATLVQEFLCSRAVRKNNIAKKSTKK